MAWAMGYLGRAIGKLAASTKPGAASGGGGGGYVPTYYILGF